MLGELIKGRIMREYIMNNKNLRKGLTVALVVALLGNTGCFFRKGDVVILSNVDSDAPGSLSGTNFDNLVSGVGMRDFKTVNYTYSSLTGVPMNNGNIVTAYNASSATLMGSMDAKQFNGPGQISQIKLASEYCNEAVNASNVNLFPGLNTITTQLLGTFVDAQRRGVATALLRNLASEKVPANVSIDALVTLSVNLGTGLASTNANLRAVLVGMCTAVLASGKVSII
jgi:hypothetical protein